MLFPEQTVTADDLPERYRIRGAAGWAGSGVRVAQSLAAVAAAEDEGERRRLWDLADRVFPQFADYRTWAENAGRVIPIIQLVPR